MVVSQKETRKALYCNFSGTPIAVSTELPWLRVSEVP